MKKYPIRHGESTRALISSQQAGRIWINNGGIKTRVHSEYLQNYLDQGWVLGRDRHHTEEFKAQASENMTGRVWVTDGTENAFVKPDDVQDYLDRGWAKGRQVKPYTLSLETLEHKRDLRVGKIYITNGTENRFVPQSDPIPEGWRRGLTKKPAVMSEESKAALSTKRRGRVWINDGVRNTCIGSGEVQGYLDSGWARGRK